MGLGDAIKAGKNRVQKDADKKAASESVKKEPTKDFFANAIKIKLQDNLRIIDQMSEDRLSQGMKNNLVNEALELLTEAYRNGNGKFKFLHPELLK
jgi:hypothetical protein